MVSVLERSMQSSGKDRHALAQATAALCVGGMVVARAMENRASADRLRDACMRVALEFGGWTGKSEAASAGPKRRRKVIRST
jgi:hypothetical protein